MQSLSCVWLFMTPWTVARQASLSFTISMSLLKLMSTESVVSSNQLIFCCATLFFPLIFPSIRVFSNELAVCIMWLKYWSFSFNISHSNESSGLVSFRIDWFDQLAVQEILKSPLQHHSLKASFLQCSAFFMVQLSHLYMNTGKVISLTIGTFDVKVISLLFNMLSSKYLHPTMQETALYMDITPWSVLKSDWLYYLQPKMEKLYKIKNNKTWSWLWLRSSAPYCKIQIQTEESREKH